MKNSTARQARFSLFRRNLNNDMYNSRRLKKSMSAKVIENLDYNNLSDSDLDKIAARRYYLGLSCIPRIMRFFNFHPLGIKSLISDNNVVNMENLPSFWLLVSIAFKPLVIVVLFVYFFVDIYLKGTTQAFVSLDKTSGLCTEIPQALSGIYRADARGNWETSPYFQYQLHNFFVNMKGVLYTPKIWTEIMSVIEYKVASMGKKTLYRDFSYNVVALGSYAAFYNSKEKGLGLAENQGSLYFYSAAEPKYIYSGTPYGSPVWISRNGTCDPVTNKNVISYEKSTGVMTLSANILSSECLGVVYKKLITADKRNDEASTKLNVFQLEFDMNSVSTALAINMGIRDIAHLVKMPGDTDRIQLLKNMLAFRHIDEETMRATSSYFDDLLAPMDPIYCTTFTGLPKLNGPDGNATQCVIRIGNALAYPIINHFGFIDGSAQKYKRCTAAELENDALNSRRLQCNLNDLLITFVMYGNEAVASDYSKTKQPTLRPTASANAPTQKPTSSPTIRPTRNTKKPTNEPTVMPTFIYNNWTYSLPFFDPYDLDDDETSPNDYYYYSGEEIGYSYNAGSGTRSGGGDDDYQRGVLDDDTLSRDYHLGEVIDPGKIFTMMRRAAAELYNDKNNIGDLYMTGRWWEFQNFAAMTSYTSAQPDASLFSNNSFAGLCEPAEDCFTLTFELYDAQISKKVNRYLYTPSNSIAFTDVFYSKPVKRGFKKLHVPPVSLIQFYYSCVMTPADSIFNALGVAKGNADLFVGAGLYMLLFAIMVWLNLVRKKNPPIPPMSHSFANWEIEAIVKEAMLRAETEKLREQREEDEALSEAELYRDKDEPLQEAVTASAPGVKIYPVSQF